jgi:hypothetical protein
MISDTTVYVFDGGIAELRAFSLEDRRWLVLTKRLGERSFWCWSSREDGARDGRLPEQEAAEQIAGLAGHANRRAFIDAALESSPAGWEFWSLGIPAPLEQTHASGALFED